MIARNPPVTRTAMGCYERADGPATAIERTPGSFGNGQYGRNEAMREQELIGSTFGAYTVLALLGNTNTITTTYRGVDLHLQRPVTIKVLRTRGAPPDIIGRFRQEARLLACLQHPNIVQIYDFGAQDGLLYIVRELLPGPTLEQRLHKMAAHHIRLSRQEIVELISQLAGALDTAHTAGIVHRNVKPGSVMWNAGGGVVLTSFEIARNTLVPANLAQAGVILGTPQYLAPEQALGQPPTPASDIYALGVVLHELIGGTPPFTGATPLAIALRQIQDPPPPLCPLRPDLPAAVDAIVQRALAKDPALRFASAGELARALAQAWPSPSTAGEQQPPHAIHALATQVWPAAAVARTRPATASSQPSPSAAAVIARAVVSPHVGSRRTLPVLTLLLVLLLLIGVLLAWRDEAAAQNAIQQKAALITSARSGVIPLTALRAVVAP
jgi:eukaryotic-like serine/threonine-protein kinase